MAKQMSIKKRLEAIFEATKPAPDGTTGEEPLSEMDKAKQVQQLARKLEKPIRTAFKKAGLDFFNDAHWKKLLTVFAVAVYGRSPGRRKSWSRRKLRKLRDDVAKIRAEHPGDRELECCKRLIRKSENHRYNKVGEATTLRRVLQTAKKLDKDARLFAASKDDAAVSDLTKILKKRP
jgi:hypothetical protein